MALALEDRWIWDFWLARDGGTYHIFFLEAPKSIGDPEARHWNASIGHAVSVDLVDWRPVGTVFRPATAPSWDDGTTWTGSVIRHGGKWWMFYTGTSLGENLKRQRIGIATSSDLHDWRRFEKNPVVELDPRYYEEYDPASWHDRSLRDPWVARNPTGDGFRMWFTARAKTGAPDGRGVIGTARSDDLLTWHAEPPVTPPGDFGECEVPQYFAAGNHAYLLFCTSERRTSAARLTTLAASGKSPETGTHYYIADRPAGPWRLAPVPFLSGSLYAGRIIEAPNGRPMFLGTIGRAADGTYVGAVSDPFPVTVAADGTLRLENAPALV